jgi:flagellar basal body-associated protein FliL
MAKKIIAALIAGLTGPFAMAFAISMLLIVGIAAGLMVAGNMEEAKLQKIKDERAAAAEALKDPPPPQRVIDTTEEGPSPFDPRYVSLGEEILSPLPGKGRVLQIEIDLVTLRGQLSEDLLTAQRIPLRALALSMLSELTIEQATAEDASQAIAEKLKQAVNAAMRPTNGVTPVQQVLIKKYYVQ